MDWDDDAISKLSRLWADGHSTGQIALLMRLTKNQVVGKAHRLNLDARPSPIRRKGDPNARMAPRAPRQTLPPLSGDVKLDEERILGLIEQGVSKSQICRETGLGWSIVTRISDGAPKPSPTPKPQAIRIEAKIIVKIAPNTAGSSRPYGRVIECCWPVTPKGKRGWILCDDPTLPGGVYCDGHTKMAYRTRKKDEDATADQPGAN
jgi:GcrA cell cycle regulator